MSYRHIRFRAAELCLLLITVPLVAMGGRVGSSRGLPTTSGGIHTIQGKVYFPASPGVQQTSQVRLIVRILFLKLYRLTTTARFVSTSSRQVPIRSLLTEEVILKTRLRMSQLIARRVMVADPSDANFSKTTT
jgi:hypothetical protein